MTAGTISSNTANSIVQTAFSEEVRLSDENEVLTFIDERGLRQVSDTGAIAALVDQVIAENPDRVADYRGGKTKLAGWFVGQVMKASGGKANPKAVNEALRAKLDE